MLNSQKIQQLLANNSQHITWSFVHYNSKVSYKTAAVLIPIILRENGISVLLTKRTKHLKHHAGQVSFPGGQANKNDESVIHTALRETNEEIGVHADEIQIINHWPCYYTLTGFAINPVLGLLDTHYQITLDTHEVEAAFELPLGFLNNKQHLETDAIDINGTTRQFYKIYYQDFVIWGATADMLVQLVNLLKSFTLPR